MKKLVKLERILMTTASEATKIAKHDIYAERDEEKFLFAKKGDTLNWKEASELVKYLMQGKIYCTASDYYDYYLNPRRGRF